MPDVKIPPKDPNLDWTVVTVKNEKPDLRKTEKPLVDLKVTNPITYIKSWWKKIIGNDGIELKVKVKPLTAIAIAIIVVTVSLGIGKFKVPVNLPFFEYSTNENIAGIIPTIEPVQESTRQAAFRGILKYDQSTGKFYLFTTNSEAIILLVEDNLNLENFIGRRIFAVGDYDDKLMTLNVVSATNLEILPTKTMTIPTDSPTPTPQLPSTCDPTCAND